MGKITFRADDDLVAEIEAFDASKSEIMREALRSYLEGQEPRDPRAPRSQSPPVGYGVTRQHGTGSIDHLVRACVDRRLDERLEARLTQRPEPQDVHVTVSLEGAQVASEADEAEVTPERKTTEANATKQSTDERAPSDTHDCESCGHEFADDHVFCPNCGEKASRRVFCECGDEVRSDWSFCPSCGRRTPAADVLGSK